MKIRFFCTVVVAPVRAAVFAVACAVAAASASATEWTYSSADSTISDGQWTLVVYRLDKKTGTIWIGKSYSGVKAWTAPSDEEKSGVLDLRSPLVLKVEGEDDVEVASVKFMGISFLCSLAKTNLREVYCDIVSEMGECCFQQCESMTRIELGGTLETMERIPLNRCKGLKTVRLDFPSLRKVKGDQCIFGYYTDPDPIDVAGLVCPGVTNLSSLVFSHKKVYGDLVLTNVMAMGSRAFENASLTNMSLAGSLDALNSKAFGGCPVTNVVLDLPRLGSVAADAFSGCSGLRSVELVSALGDMGLVTNLVAAVASVDSVAGCSARILVSRRQWTPSEAETYDAETNTAGFFVGKDAFTDGERDALAGDPELAKAFGALVVGGKRKAIFVHKQSVHDPVGRGAVIIVR